MGEIKEPELITADHELKDFDCGNNTLNEWLKKRALSNQDKFSVTRVVCVVSKVIAYYTLAYGSVSRTEMTRKFQTNAPDIIPIMVLGKLAVDLKWQGKGIAKHLLKESMLKTVEASKIAATRGILVHAIDDKAASFYKRYGFIDSKIDLTLLLPIEDIKAQF